MSLFATESPRPTSSAPCSTIARKKLSYEQQKKSILLDVRNSQYALQQAQARVTAAQKARDLAQKTFDIAKQEQKLGAMSDL